MDQRNLGYRELIKALTFELTIISELFDGTQKYQSLLKILREYAPKEERPYQKNLMKKLEMSRSDLMDLLLGLYRDFQSVLSESGAYPIKNTEYWLLARSRTDYWVIGVDTLEYLPSVGDDFDLWFVRDKWGGNSFKVERVSHEIENGTHRIHISLIDSWVEDENSPW